MAKPEKITRIVSVVEPKSMRDAGMQAARTGDSLSKLATWLGANCKGYPNEVSKDDRRLFKDGVFVHYQTVKSPVYLRREGNNLIEQAKPEKFTDMDVTVDVAYATGLTEHQLGALKKSDPALHEVVTKYRNECNVYAGNRWKAVLTFWRAEHSKPRARSSNNTFNETYAAFFDSTAKKLARKRQAGDPTAPTDEKFKLAVRAFWKALA